MKIPVLEELMMQIGSLQDEEEPSDLNEAERSPTRCQALGGQCDIDGKFLPTQCDEEEACWCVDEAGNQILQTNTFKKGEISCSKCFFLIYNF